MKIGIICATDGELAPILPVIADRSESVCSMLKIHEGTIFGEQVTALYSGVGKVNAAIAAQTLLLRGVDIVINAGVAGSMRSDVEVLDTVVSTEVWYHDINPDTITEYHPWVEEGVFASDARLVELARLAAADMPEGHAVHFGRTVTGDIFVTNELRPSIAEKHAPLAVDMESAAVAHACYQSGVPFIAVRSISDSETHDGAESVDANFDSAARRACALLLLLVEKIHERRQ